MNAKAIPAAKFRLGRVVATANALGTIMPDDVLVGILRHQAGDWGLLQNGDRAQNEHALLHGGRLVSAYLSVAGVKFYLITEADRSVTTVLLPEDY